MILQISVCLTVLGSLGLGFGAWGGFTQAGSRRFDEMAGMIPFFAFYLGVFLLVVSLILWGVVIYRQLNPVLE